LTRGDAEVSGAAKGAVLRVHLHRERAREESRAVAAPDLHGSRADDEPPARGGSGDAAERGDRWRRGNLHQRAREAGVTFVDALDGARQRRDCVEIDREVDAVAIAAVNPDWSLD